MVLMEADSAKRYTQQFSGIISFNLSNKSCKVNASVRVILHMRKRREDQFSKAEKKPALSKVHNYRFYNTSKYTIPFL